MAGPQHYVVYILLCADDTLYTGITTNMTRRFEEHQAGTASKYTRARRVVSILYQEQCTTRSRALQREAAIKKLTRKQKESLVRMSGDN